MEVQGTSAGRPGVRRRVRSRHGQNPPPIRVNHQLIRAKHQLTSTRPPSSTGHRGGVSQTGARRDRRYRIPRAPQDLTLRR